MCPAVLRVSSWEVTYAHIAQPRQRWSGRQTFPRHFFCLMRGLESVSTSRRMNPSVLNTTKGGQRDDSSWALVDGKDKTQDIHASGGRHCAHCPTQPPPRELKPRLLLHPSKDWYIALRDAHVHRRAVPQQEPTLQPCRQSPAFKRCPNEGGGQCGWQSLAQAVGVTTSHLKGIAVARAISTPKVTMATMLKWSAISAAKTTWLDESDLSSLLALLPDVLGPSILVFVDAKKEWIEVAPSFTGPKNRAVPSERVRDVPDAVCLLLQAHHFERSQGWLLLGFCRWSFVESWVSKPEPDIFFWGGWGGNVLTCEVSAVKRQAACHKHEIRPAELHLCALHVCQDGEDEFWWSVQSSTQGRRMVSVFLRGLRAAWKAS